MHLYFNRYKFSLTTDPKNAYTELPTYIYVWPAALYSHAARARNATSWQCAQKWNEQRILTHHTRVIICIRRAITLFLLPPAPLTDHRVLIFLASFSDVQPDVDTHMLYLRRAACLANIYISASQNVGRAGLRKNRCSGAPAPRLFRRMRDAKWANADAFFARAAGKALIREIVERYWGAGNVIIASWIIISGEGVVCGERDFPTFSFGFALSFLYMYKLF